jgi:hypothetical protein
MRGWRRLARRIAWWCRLARRIARSTASPGGVASPSGFALPGGVASPGGSPGGVASPGGSLAAGRPPEPTSMIMSRLTARLADRRAVKRDMIMKPNCGRRSERDPPRPAERDATCVGRTIRNCL